MNHIWNRIYIIWIIFLYILMYNKNMIYADDIKLNKELIMNKIYFFCELGK